MILGEEQVQCPHCPQTVQRQSLRIHLERKHPGTFKTKCMSGQTNDVIWVRGLNALFLLLEKC